MSWSTAGHCRDIDGGLYHDPGECPGAILNCSGRCCGPTPAPTTQTAASVRGDGEGA